jgi:hypothetical protein
MCNANDHLFEANNGLLETIDKLRAIYVRTANERDRFEKMVLAMSPVTSTAEETNKKLRDRTKVLELAVDGLSDETAGLQ